MTPHPVPVLRLQDLGGEGGSAFEPVVGAAAPARSQPFPLLRERGWREESLPAIESIGPLGLHRLRDVTLCGSGYLFHRDRFVLEEAHTSRVALQWLRQPDFPDNPYTTPPVNDVVVERLALPVFGPGFPIWGHVLLDYLPRIALARHALAGAFAELLIPVPADAPDWLPEALGFFCGVQDGQLLRYDRHRDRLHLVRAVLPSFAHDGEHVPHPFATAFYHGFRPERTGPPPSRRLCLSRRRFERETRSAWRVFEGRDAFERMAAERGYEIVCPEDLPFADQIALFGDASHLIGEYGSGLHNAVFSRPGTRVGCFPFSNAIQARIADAGGQAAAFVDRLHRRTDERGVVFFTVDPADLAALFDRVEGAPVAA